VREFDYELIGSTLMTIMATGIPACLLYLIAASMQWWGLRDSQRYQNLVYGLGAIAITLHGITAWIELVTPDGINMSIYVMGSVISFVITLLTLASSLRRPISNLFIGLFPLATATLLLSMFAEGNYTLRPDLSLGIYGHIVLSVLAYSLLTIAAFQAVFLAFLDYELRNKNLTMVQKLPALQTMEAMLFELLWGGLIFLSLSIATGFFFFNTSEVPGLIHHTVITFAAWIVFSILLWGRYQMGWRGSIAARWTLGGFVLLALGYFGSKLVLEVILGG